MASIDGYVGCLYVDIVLAYACRISTQEFHLHTQTHKHTHTDTHTDTQILMAFIITSQQGLRHGSRIIIHIIVSIQIGCLQFYDRGNCSMGTISGIIVAVNKIIVIPPQAIFNFQNSYNPMLFSHRKVGTQVHRQVSRNIFLPEKQTTLFW